jgi:protein-S-isoprenylcysteine O-methyltransferase Ste14
MPEKDDMPRNAAGTVLMVLGIAMLIYDHTQGWDTIWATAIGIKLIVVAVIFLVWGPLRRLDQRRSE